MDLKTLHFDSDKLKDICNRYQVTRLEVFGSFSRGDAEPDSDLDILVTFRAGARIGLKLVALAGELESLFGRHVDIVTRSAVEHSPNKYFRRFALDSTEAIFEHA